MIGPRECLVYHDRRGCTITEARRIPGSHTSASREGWLEAGQGLKIGIRTNWLVSIDNNCAFLLFDLNRHNFVLEAPGGCGRGRLLMTLKSETILRLARDAKFLGDNLGLVAHVDVLEGTPEAIIHHGID